jgi:GLPGLI family protein
MKKVLFLLLVVNFAFAQQSIKVTYELLKRYPENYFDAFPEYERVKVKEQFTKPRVFTLTSNGDFSIYESPEEKTATITSNIADTETKINLGTTVKTPPIWLLKDFKKKKSFDQISIDETEYYVERDFPNVKMQYSSKEKIIENYNCKMAFSIKENARDTIRYWYTDKISVSDGPLSIVGTPGLVLMYESTKGVIYATKIEFFDKKIIFEELKNKFPILSESKYKEILIKSYQPKTYTDEQGRVNSESTIKYQPK